MNQCLTGWSDGSSRLETALSTISLVKCWCVPNHKHTHEYGIEIPQTVEEAYAIDKATHTIFLHDVIEKKMNDMCVSFDILADGAVPPPDHQIICCHMIFDAKMDDFLHWPGS
jgi:hypothetical protein